MKSLLQLKKQRNVEIVLQVKKNQRKLLSKSKELVKTIESSSKHVQKDKKKRGRIEKRTVTVFHKKDFELGDVWDLGIKTVIQVVRENKIFNTKTKKFTLRKETAIYVSTTDKLSAKQFADIIRSHWSIENINHYVRDVTLKEDFSRVRKNPENVATLRSFALNLLRANSEKNISQTVYRNALNIKRVLGYVGVKKVQNS